MGDGPFLPPWLLQVFGLLLIAAFSIHWWLTGQESALLVGVGVTLATLGGLNGANQRLKRRLYKGRREEEDDDSEGGGP